MLLWEKNALLMDEVEVIAMGIKKALGNAL